MAVVDFKPILSILLQKKITFANKRMKKIKILIVEDEQGISRFLSEGLLEDRRGVSLEDQRMYQRARSPLPK